MRRIAVVFVVALLALATTASVRAAAEARSSPPAAFAEYPELRIKATPDGFELPSQVTAGRTLITLDNALEGAIAAHLLQVPADVKIADLQAFVEGGAEWYDLAAKPWVGFPGEAVPGRLSQAVVDLAPGRYGLLSPPMYAVFDAVEGAGATQAIDPEPTAGTVKLADFAFELPQEIAPGPQIWKLTNSGKEVHHIVLMKAPGPITAEEVVASLAVGKGTEAPAGVPNVYEFERAGGIGFLSPGLTAWTAVDLAPGIYVAFCAAFDEETDEPHATMRQMVTVFTVG
jgi:hypothetical protein